MKVLFVTNTPNSRLTGMARIMHFVRDESLKSGWSLDLLFAEDVPCGFSSRRWRQLCFPYFFLFVFLRQHIKNKYDLVMVHTTEGAFYVLLRKIFKSLPPCVIVSFGADEMRWELENEEERLGYIQRSPTAFVFYYPWVVLGSRFATENADHVIVAAKTEIDFFEKRYAMPRSKITFIPNGVGRNFFIDRDYSRPVRKLLYVGGWEWRKGIRYLIEAFSRLAEKYPDLRLSIAGISKQDGDVRRVFPENLRCRIDIFLEVTPQMYADHDLFVFPSLFESMSLVVPEAMASGMPVVTTRACGMQDIVEDQVSGFLIPPRNTDLLVQRISDLINDSRLCERLGKAAREKAKELEWGRIAPQFEAVCRKVLR